MQVGMYITTGPNLTTGPQMIWCIKLPHQWHMAQVKRQGMANQCMPLLCCRTSPSSVQQGPNCGL